jgi:hypothetical protein
MFARENRLYIRWAAKSVYLHTSEVINSVNIGVNFIE